MRGYPVLPFHAASLTLRAVCTLSVDNFVKILADKWLFASLLAELAGMMEKQAVQNAFKSIACDETPGIAGVSAGQPSIFAVCGHMSLGEARA